MDLSGGYGLPLTPMARPTITDRDMVRSKGVLIKLRPHQYQRWAARAHKEGVPLAAWVRQVADRAARTS